MFLQIVLPALWPFRISIPAAIGVMWQALGIIWLVGLLFRRPTVAQQSLTSRLFQSGVAILGFLLLGSNWLAVGWLAAHFVPSSEAIQSAAFLVVLGGCVIAIWARVTLGGNWSGRVSLQQGHTLIEDGPYSLIRHPIYTGLLLASTGTALAIGQVRCIIGLVLIAIALSLKMSLEERLMSQVFPNQYPRYCRRVKALIPGLL